MGCIWYTNQQVLVGGCTSHANPEQAWTSKTRAKPPASKKKENEHSSVSLGVSTPILKLVSRVVCVSLRSFIASDYPWSLSISQVQNQSHKVYQGAMLSCGSENDGFIWIYTNRKLGRFCSTIKFEVRHFQTNPFGCEFSWTTMHGSLKDVRHVDSL